MPSQKYIAAISWIDRQLRVRNPLVFLVFFLAATSKVIALSSTGKPVAPYAVNLNSISPQTVRMAAAGVTKAYALGGGVPKRVKIRKHRVTEDTEKYHLCVLCDSVFQFNFSIGAMK